MSESEKKGWHELCAAVASEHDPEKLGLLVEELLRALDDRRSESQVATRQTATTNRLFAIK